MFARRSTYLVLMIVECLYTLFVLDVPQLDKAVGSRGDELHTRRQEVET